MQQLQSNYRGDTSPSLAQIFGMQYQPQGATSQMANTALSSGMSAGAQIKATSMNNDTQMAISNAARMENRRQFNLTNALAGRTANETQRHNMALEGISKQTTDWQTGGSIAADDQKALGAVQGQITEMEMVLNMLNKSDPQYAAKAAMIQGRIKSLRDGARAASGARGGATGFAAQTGRMFDAKGGSFTIESGNLLDAVAAANRPKAQATPTPKATPTPTATSAAPATTPLIDPSLYKLTPSVTLSGLMSPTPPATPATTPATSAAALPWWNPTGTATASPATAAGVTVTPGSGATPSSGPWWNPTATATPAATTTTP